MIVPWSRLTVIAKKHDAGGKQHRLLELRAHVV